MREARALTVGILVGAGMMYLLDPRQGGARRAMIRDKSRKAVHEVEHAASIGARDLENRARGAVASLARGDRHASGVVLEERVRATLGRVCSHPGAIAVAARGEGCIELSGPILASDVDHVLAAVLRVRGVETIDNDLAVHSGPVGVPGLEGEPARRTHAVKVAPAAKLLGGILASSVAIGSIVTGHPVGLLLGGGSVLAIARSTNARGVRRRHLPSSRPHVASP